MDIRVLLLEMLILWTNKKNLPQHESIGWDYARFNMKVIKQAGRERYLF